MLHQPRFTSPEAWRVIGIGAECSSSIGMSVTGGVFCYIPVDSGTEEVPYVPTNVSAS